MVTSRAILGINLGMGKKYRLLNLSRLQMVAFHLADTFYAKHFTVH